jgi:hypothetical protein
MACMQSRHGTLVGVLAGALMSVMPFLAASAHVSGEFAAGVATEIAHSRMQALDVLVGQWSLTSVEHTANGDALRSEGVRTCRWALNGTAIRCDDRFDPLGRLNGTRQPLSISDSLFYLSFNGNTGSYEYTYYSPSLPELHTVQASFDEALQVLTGSAWVTDQIGKPRLAINESRLLSSDHIQETVSISTPGSDGRLELLEISLVRRDQRPGQVLHF